MTWRVVVRSKAEQELTETVLWYDKEQEGLGDRFVDSVHSLFKQLARNPRIFARRDQKREVRQALLKPFPYFVAYEIREREHTIVIAAIVHSARHERHRQA